MAPLNPVRVVLADDHPIWRDGVRADLADGFTVVAALADLGGLCCGLSRESAARFSLSTDVTIDTSGV